MSAPASLHALFSYQAWANDELLKKMEGFDPEQHKEEHHTALRLINHSLVVNQIFAAHLVGEKNKFSADNTPGTPSLPDLHRAIAASDRWYLEYLREVTAELLSESVSFVFTDGDSGYMTREEMLSHVVTHGGYHRGEVGRIMTQLSLPLPWDTFAVYLHSREPMRRMQIAE